MSVDIKSVRVMSSFTKLVTAETAAVTLGSFTAMELCSNAQLAADDPTDRDHEDAVICRQQLADVEAYEAAHGSLFWHAPHSVGGRRVIVDDGAIELRVGDWGFERDYFSGHRPEDVVFAEFTSASSGSGLRWTRLGLAADGITVAGWLEFVPATDDPEYRGSYYGAFDSAPSIGA